MMMRAIIMDLDNTLYSWMDAYAPSFWDLVTYLEETTCICRDDIINDFKRVFKVYGSVEIPNAIYELQLWSKLNTSDRNICTLQNQAQIIFFDNFRSRLQLFPSVMQTLISLKEKGVLLFGFSDAFAFWIDYRLNTLEIINLFDAVFATSNDAIENANIVINRKISNRIFQLSKEKAKPSTAAIDQIICDYGLNRNNVVMVGDSIEKDVKTAQQAGIIDVWAKYGTQYCRENGRILRRITPWEKKKQADESTIGKIVPTHTILDFSEISIFI